MFAADVQAPFVSCQSFPDVLNRRGELILRGAVHRANVIALAGTRNADCGRRSFRPSDNITPLRYRSKMRTSLLRWRVYVNVKTTVAATSTMILICSRFEAKE